MKKALLMLAIALAGSTAAMAFNTITVHDSISTNTHWTNDQQYLLQGYVYVTNGATLTIDSGTVIRGDKNTKGSLIIERGAKLIAIGSPTAPIVFTSNQAPGNRTYGDWGGLIICGKAYTNWSTEPTVEGGPRSKYGPIGGNAANADNHDNSGTLRYVRIEFPGIAFSANNEINGLTLCGVGDGTTIDHIQVSYSGDDSYEWFGGTVNAKYLISHRTWDDDFDTDNGYTGKNQFVVGLRDPFIADNSGSKGFESDSYQPGGVTTTGVTDTMSLTKPVFSNVTLSGPLVNPSNIAGIDPQFVSAVHIRRGSAISILNSVLFGFPAGVLFDESVSGLGTTTANIANGSLQFRNNIIAGIATNSTNAPNGQKEVVYVKNGARSITPTNTNADTATGNPFAPYAGPFSWLNASGNKISIYATEQNGVRLQNPFTLTNPDFRPTSTSPVSYNAAHAFNPANPINPDTTGNYANYNMPIVVPDFSNNKSNDPFFTKVNYVGAFSGNLVTQENWFSCWTNFDPVNTDYSTYANTMHGGCSPTAVNAIVNTIQNAKVSPNPASSSALILFELNENGNIAISMTDITGKVVAEIFNGTETKGIHSVTANLSNVNAGLYFIHISSAKGTKTMKLTVTR